METQLIASSSTLEGVLRMIQDYYYNPKIELRQVPDTELYLVIKDGKALSSIVRKKGKRFRFEL